MFNRRQPCRGTSHDPVAWVAWGRETDPAEPIDEAVLGTVSELSGRNTRERRGSPETDEAPEAEPFILRRRQEGATHHG